MATQLKNIIEFSGVASGGQATLPHGLNVNANGVIPDKIEFDNGRFSYVSADDTEVTVQNDGAAPADCNVLCEHWHTFERVFGPRSVKALNPQPFVVEGEGGSSSIPNPLVLSDGDAATDIAGADSGVLSADGAASGGTEAVKLNGSGFVGGVVDSGAALGSAQVVQAAPGGFASGKATSDGEAGADALIENLAAATGAFAGGFAEAGNYGYGGGAGTIRAEQAGGFAFGHVSDIWASYATGPVGSQLIRAQHCSFALGSTTSYGLGTATVEALSSTYYSELGGSFAFGTASGGAYSATIQSQMYGSAAFGQASGFFYPGGIFAAPAAPGYGFACFAHGTARSGVIRAEGAGSMARGSAVITGAEPDGIRTSYGGAGGAASGYAREAGSRIEAISYGAFANGEARQGAHIHAGGGGGVALGRAVGGAATYAYIGTSGGGSFAQGYATNDGTITASSKGSFASGYASGSYDVLASAVGAFALGAARAANVQATAINAFQFGEGSNALADSLQVGSAGVRLKGTVGAPGAPQNGDQWVDGAGNVVIRSGGVSVIIA